MADGRAIILASAALAIQAVAAIYFVGDGIDDALVELRSGWSLELAMECMVAIALLLAVIVSARQLRRMIEEGRRQQQALSIARGAFDTMVAAKFSDWGLSPSERDVALFTLKGCTISDIAAMRNAAEGTVRSQLSQVYAKAGVADRAMLLSQFIEELL
jgi:DNA-binding NarL/FixJ family response regulator